MLPDKFKEDVREIIALAKECPDSLQEKCLQMLLDDYLTKSSAPRIPVKVSPPPPPPDGTADKEEEQLEPPGKLDETPGQRDLVTSDLHLKAKKFLSQSSLTIDDINQLFFVEKGEIKPL